MDFSVLCLVLCEKADLGSVGLRWGCSSIFLASLSIYMRKTCWPCLVLLSRSAVHCAVVTGASASLGLRYICEGLRHHWSHWVTLNSPYSGLCFTRWMGMTYLFVCWYMHTCVWRPDVNAEGQCSVTFHLDSETVSPRAQRSTLVTFT